jgi:hypothetical protein
MLIEIVFIKLVLRNLCKSKTGSWMKLSEKEIQNEYLEYIKSSNFPCVGAKTALSLKRLKIMVAGNMKLPCDDRKILNFLYGFVDFYRSTNAVFLSCAIIFPSSKISSEEEFENLLWQKLQALSDFDSANYEYDKRVSHDPKNEKFSFSLKGESFFIVGIHPSSSRPGRRFKYPTLIFNPHHQFEILREKNCFTKIKNATRKRDEKISGNLNPMLQDYGASSEALQYSGKKYDENWQCPLKIKHAKN